MNNGRRLYYIALVFLFLTLLGGCGRNSDKEPSTPSEEKKEAALIPAAKRQKMPDFTLPAIQDGAPVNSRNFLGRITVVAFFSPWCSDCVSEMGMLEKFRKSSLGAEFSAVGMAVVEEEDEGELTRFVKELGIKFPVVLSNRTLEDAFGGFVSVPTAYLIDKKGRIARQYIRHLKKDRLAAAVDLLRREP